jgi:hypothetical protein
MKLTACLCIKSLEYELSKFRYHNLIKHARNNPTHFAEIILSHCLTVVREKSQEVHRTSTSRRIFNYPLTLLKQKIVFLFQRSRSTVNLFLFGPKRDEVTGEWRKLHNEELNDLYSSPNTVRVIKSRMR